MLHRPVELARDFGKIEVRRPARTGEVAENPVLRELQFLGSCKGLFSSFEIRPTLWRLAGWLVKSQLMIYSPESMIEYFVLPRVKNNKVMGVADEDAPEEPRRQHPIAR